MAYLSATFSRGMHTGAHYINFTIEEWVRPIPDGRYQFQVLDLDTGNAETWYDAPNGTTTREMGFPPGTLVYAEGFWRELDYEYNPIGPWISVSTVTFQLASPPPDPTGLTLVSIEGYPHQGTGQVAMVTFEWDDMIEIGPPTEPGTGGFAHVPPWPASSYHWLYSGTNGAASGDVTESRVTFPVPINGEYDFYVESIGEWGSSNDSYMLNWVVTRWPFPLQPTNLQITVQGLAPNATVTATWNPPTGENQYNVADGYNYDYSGNEFGDGTLVGHDNTSVSFTVTKEGVYDFDVESYNRAGTGSDLSASFTVGAVTPPPPPMPTGVIIEVIGGAANPPDPSRSATIKVKWNPSPSGPGIPKILKYDILIYDPDFWPAWLGPSDFDALGNPLPSVTVNEGLYIIGGYYFLVGAIDENNKRSPDAFVGFIVPEGTGGPSRPLDWEWYTQKVSGGDFNIEGGEWNDFLSRINEFRAYKALPEEFFLPYDTGDPFTADAFNLAADHVSQVSGMAIVQYAPGDDIFAFAINKLRNDLNSTV